MELLCENKLLSKYIHFPVLLTKCGLYCKKNAFITSSSLSSTSVSSTVSAFDFISNFRLDSNGVSGVRRTRGSNQYQTAYKISPDADVRISTRCARRLLQTSLLINQIIIRYISSCCWIKTTDVYAASAFFRRLLLFWSWTMCVSVSARVLAPCSARVLAPCSSVGRISSVWSRDL